MNNEKIMNIARLMTAYNLEINMELLPDNLKCEKCKLVVKIACQVPCGCTFCRACIDDLMVSGNRFCPGILGDCGESLLSGFVTDFKANKNVSKLVVKCPQNGCVHECELAGLEEHMRVCGRKNVKCPFHELGCQQDKLAAEEMTGHFQLENRSHCEILIGMIADINREMESHKIEIEMLKRSDERKKNEIEMLKDEMVLKDRKITSILDQMGHIENEIKSIKQEKADLADHMRILSAKIELEIYERRESDERDMANMIEHIDREITAITAVIGSTKDELGTAMTIVKDDIRSINQNRIKSIMGDIECIKSQMQSIQELVGLGQIDASCEWTIDEDVRNIGLRASEYFTGEMYPYKCLLISDNNHDDREMWIYLRIHPGASDAQLPWPLSGTVSITVADRINPELCQNITEQCEISRPANNRFSYSDAFKFSHSSLIGAGLDLTRGVHVSCVIVPSRARR